MSTTEPFTAATRRRIRRAAANLNPRADIILPPGPYLDADGDLLDAGKALIHTSVAAGNMIAATVARQLGMTVRAFNKKIKDETSDFFEEWAVANADIDSAALRENTYQWKVLHNPERLAFHLRIRGYSEKTAPAAVVNTGPTTNMVLVPPGENYETFVRFAKEMAAEGKSALPSSYSKAEYNAKLAAGELFQGGENPADIAPLPTLGPRIEPKSHAPIVTPPERKEYSK